METLAKIILGISVLAGLSQFAEAGEKRVGVEAGILNGQPTVGASVKVGKYTSDVMTGVGSKTKTAVSVGIYRDIVKVGNIEIGAGLSANKTTEQKGKILTIRQYQGYDLQLGYKLDKFNLRGTINSNGDAKVGIGFSF